MAQMQGLQLPQFDGGNGFVLVRASFVVEIQKLKEEGIVLVFGEGIGLEILEGTWLYFEVETGPDFEEETENEKVEEIGGEIQEENQTGEGEIGPQGNYFAQKGSDVMVGVEEIEEEVVG